MTPEEPSGPGRTRRWSPRAAGGAGMATVVVLGVAATVISVTQARNDARSRDERAVEAVAERFSVRLHSSLASLRGADGLATGGSVDGAAFDAFADDLVSPTGFIALSYAEIVPETDRVEWQTSTGLTMTDLGQGAFIDADPRDVHVAVRYVHPVNDLTRPLLGFDLAGEPTRGAGIEAAITAGEAVVGPIELARSGDVGIFVIRAVTDLDGRPIGFVAAGLALDALIGTEDDLRDVAGLRMWIDGEPMLPPDGNSRPDAGVDVAVAGHNFTVEAHDRRGADQLPSIAFAGCTALLGVGLLMTLRRARSERQREQVARERADRVADLAEALSATMSMSETVALLTERMRPILGADLVALTLPGLMPDAHAVEVFDGTRQSLSAEEFDVRFGAHVPLLRALHESRAVPDRAHARTSNGHPTADDEFADALCAPIAIGIDRTAGAVGFAWRRTLDRDEMDDMAATLQLTTLLAGRALERSMIRELVQSRVEQLSELARLLSVARSTAEIQELVARRVPRLLEVNAAEFGDPGRQLVGNVRVYPAPSPLGEDLHLLLPTGMAWTPTLQALTEALLQLIEGAWIRAREHEQEHQVLQRLQATLLLPAPEIDGFDVAVAYRSALEAVGIGGDWYSVIDRPDAVHLVVGDVAGHGAGAVAIMAECKTILRHHLTSGTGIIEALEHADAALRRRNAYASVIIVSVEKNSGELRYLNAGHPAPIVVSAHGAVALTDVHRPWLGVDHHADTLSRVAFPSGSLVLLYTDGLIEDRRVPLDESVDTLVRHVADGAEAPQALVDRLIAERMSDRAPSAVDDDIAMIALRRL